MNTNRPNVLLFMTDDQGWDDLSCHGNPYIQTPHLDKLASQSVQFDNYYVASVCAPSRASLLTGRHFLRTGVAHVHGGKDFIHREETLIGEYFSQAGYETAMWGKWHSGKTSGYLPWERGFKQAYMAQLYKHQDSCGYLNGTFVEHQGRTVDTLTQYADAFFAQRKDDGKNFFAFIPHLTPHGPLNAPAEHIQALQDQHGLSTELATLYAMIEELDRSVGEVLSSLEQHGFADNTIVLFMSDNGPACNENIFSDEDRALRNVNGYLGHKGNMWERGVKSPLFIRWPQAFAPRHVTRLCDICDILPTLLDCCDIAPATCKLDGRSIKSYCLGDENSLDEKESFIWVSPGWPPDPERGYSIMGVQREYHPIAPEEKPALPNIDQLASIRTETFKLLRNPGRVPNQPELVDNLALFHMPDDPKEGRNLAASHTQERTTLEQRLDAWFKDIKAEAHAFHMPQFIIGREEPQCFVAAYGPVRCFGNPSNAGNGLFNWQAAGDAAEYEIKVESAGRYEIALSYSKTADKHIECRLSISDQDLDVTLPDACEHILGEMDLQTGEQLMRFAIQECETHHEAIIEKIVMFRFKRITTKHPEISLSD